ncbi:translation initiation factor IF-2 N-terminal domain-containing protein [Lactococcus muris]|uniref:Translation initiation factor IF-2 N-terminal domain-containing protein n=1 Tax=Lactococcus muris TaxID=2941330 RepID=A0ABV4D642_9LACT
MKIYKLARELGVKSQALLFLAQKEGIEAKSVASPLTEDEMDKLLVAFDEAGGVLEPLLEETQEVAEAKEKEEEPVPQKASPVAPLKKLKKKDKMKKVKGESAWDKIESMPKTAPIDEPVQTGKSKAYLLYRIFTVAVTLFFVFLGFTALHANRQVAQVTESVNVTTQTLMANQKALDKKIEALNKEIQTLKEKEAKAQEASKKAKNDKKMKTAPKQKPKK